MLRTSAAWFREVSGGRYSVSGVVTPWLRVRRPANCLNGANNVGNQALAAAQRRGYRLASFERFILVMPCRPPGGILGLRHAPRPPRRALRLGQDRRRPRAGPQPRPAARRRAPVRQGPTGSDVVATVPGDRVRRRDRRDGQLPGRSLQRVLQGPARVAEQPSHRDEVPGPSGSPRSSSGVVGSRRSGCGPAGPRTGSSTGPRPAPTPTCPRLARASRSACRPDRGPNYSTSPRGAGLASIPSTTPTWLWGAPGPLPRVSGSLSSPRGGRAQ